MEVVACCEAFTGVNPSAAFLPSSSGFESTIAGNEGSGVEFTAASSAMEALVVVAGLGVLFFFAMILELLLLISSPAGC
jgi:hypothetical protein